MFRDKKLILAFVLYIACMAGAALLVSSALQQVDWDNVKIPVKVEVVNDN